MQDHSQPKSDIRSLRRYRTPGPEADHFLVLRRDAHYDPPQAEVFDGEPERGTADAVDDDIELTDEMLGDSRGAEVAHQLAGRGGIAYQRGDMSAARMGELDRHPPDSAGRAGDQYALAEHQASDRERPQRCQPGWILRPRRYRPPHQALQPFFDPRENGQVQLTAHYRVREGTCNAAN